MSHLLTQCHRSCGGSPIIRTCFAIVLLASFSGFASGQGVGGTRGLPSSSDGIHTIQGRVYAPDGRPVSTHLRIRLDSPNTSSLTAVTDEDGAFSFGSLQAGNYRLAVEGGSAFETAYEYLSIYPSPGGRIVKLVIHLRAKESADPALASAPTQALKSYKNGMEAARSGDSKKAVELLEAAIAAYPKLTPALNELGVQYLKLGQPDKAAAALEAAVKLAPDDFHPRLNYGIALLNQKKFAQSEEQLRIALKKNAAAPTAHMYLGIALMNQQKLDDAEKELQTAVSSNNSEVAMAHRYLGGIYWGKRDYKRAADELETYLKLVPKAADADRTRAAIKDLRSKE